MTDSEGRADVVHSFRCGAIETRRMTIRRGGVITIGGGADAAEVEASAGGRLSGASSAGGGG